MNEDEVPETSEEARQRIERDTAEKQAAKDAAKEQPGLQVMAADTGEAGAQDDTAEDRILLDELVSITGQLNVVADRLNAFLKKATTPGA